MAAEDVAEVGGVTKQVQALEMVADLFEQAELKSEGIAVVAITEEAV